ncbi:MAG: tRNA (adenine-N1)-methyltransferase [Nitrososphaerales archaeon]
MTFNNAIQEGQYVLLYLDKKRKWLVKILKDAKIHTHVGYVTLNTLIGKSYGSSIESSLGVTLWALKPTIEDYALKAERKTQVVYPKDMGMIAVKTGVSSGSIVVEAGTGSGVLCMFLANLVRPNGHVYSYEIRKEFLELAKKNLEKAGLSKYVTLKEADARKGLDVVNADVAIIDVGDPWSLVKPMYNALKGGGMLAAICPTMNQVEKLVEELKANNFIDIESMEVIVRGLEARMGMTRPVTRMIAHTAYLTFARKTQPSDKG